MPRVLHPVRRAGRSRGPRSNVAASGNAWPLAGVLESKDIDEGRKS
jgi:hypothetical protein